MTARIRRLLASFVQPPPVTRQSIERTEPDSGTRQRQPGLFHGRDGGHRGARAARHGPDFAIRAAGDPHRARLVEPQQSARVGLRLRGLRRSPRRAERPRLRPDGQRPAGARAAWPRRGWSSPRKRSSSGPITTLATTAIDVFRPRPPALLASRAISKRRRRAIEEARRAKRARTLPAVRVRRADALGRGGPAARRGPGRRPLAGAAGIRPCHERDLPRRPAVADPRPVPGSPHVPHVVRPDAGR